MKKFYALLAALRAVIGILLMLPFVLIAWIAAALCWACNGPIWLNHKAFQLTDRFVYWY